jgi:hypothetical protein
VLCATKGVNIVKQGTTAKTIRWPCMMHLVSNVTIWRPTSRGMTGDQCSKVAKKCLKVRFLRLESVLWDGSENYTFTVCATGVATVFPVV